MNATAGTFQTVCEAFNIAASNLRYKNAFVDAIYWDNRPEDSGVIGQTFQVIIPTVNEGGVVDIQSGPIQPVDYSFNPETIVLNHNDSYTIIIKSWDQVRTPWDLARIYLAPGIEGLKRKINRRVVTVFNATNFPNYTLFTGTSSTASDFARADFATAWTNLVNVGVPIEDDPDNVTLMVNPLTWGVMSTDQSFYYQYIVGEQAGNEAAKRAKLANALGARMEYDQMLVPFNSGHQPGILFHRYAVAGVSVAAPSLNSNAIDETYEQLPGSKLTIQIQMAPSLQDQGVVIHLHCMYGIAVVRPEMGSLFQTES